jgi:hypothetical protein
MEPPTIIYVRPERYTSDRGEQWSLDAAEAPAEHAEAGNVVMVAVYRFEGYVEVSAPITCTPEK